MNREERRRAATNARRNGGINWHAEPPDLCPTATKIITLVRADADGWVVQHDACDRCGLYTLVAHDGEMVFACLACGRHGALTEAGATHTTNGMRLH